MADLKYYDVIKRPVLTEKSMNAMAEKKYTFLVHPDATKNQVADAVEKMFDGTKVAKVNTVNYDGKTKRRGNTFGKMYDPLYPPEYVELFGGKRLGREYIKTAFSLPIYETAARYQGPALIVHGTGDRVVPYTYGERFHSIWPKSEYVQLDGFDHGFSQNIYRADRIVSEWLINRLRLGD